MWIWGSLHPLKTFISSLLSRGKNSIFLYPVVSRIMVPRNLSDVIPFLTFLLLIHLLDISNCLGPPLLNSSLFSEHVPNSIYAFFTKHEIFFLFYNIFLSVSIANYILISLSAKTPLCHLVPLHKQTLNGFINENLYKVNSHFFF